MQLVQQPAHELDGVSLLGDLEPPGARERHLLQELVRRDLGLEKLRVPDLLRQLREPPYEFGRFRFNLELRGVGVEEEVAKRRDMEEGVNDDVEVVIGLDIVESDISGEVGAGGEVVRDLGEVGEASDLGGGEAGVENVEDAGERGVGDLVAVGEDIKLRRQVVRGGRTKNISS